MTTIGKTIAHLRKQKGMTQSELADKMDVTDKAVSKWERDLACPDVNTISKLADVLDVSVEELLTAKQTAYEHSRFVGFVQLVFRAVALAMGVAVLALNIMDKIEIRDSIIMLSVGMASISISLFCDKR